MGFKDLFSKVKNKFSSKDNYPEQSPADLLKAEAAEMESYTTPKGYIMEERLREELDFTMEKGVSFNIYLIYAGYGKEKLPTIYFSNLIDKIASNTPIVRNSFAYNFLTEVLCKQAKPFFKDKDKQIKERANRLSSEEMISATDNPVLAFASKFNFYEFKTDIDGELADKFAVFMDIVNFLAVFSGIDETIPINKDILQQNPWILDKQTYYNKLGIVKDKKSFLKDCYEISGNKYFELMLED